MKNGPDKKQKLRLNKKERRKKQGKEPSRSAKLPKRQGRRPSKLLLPRLRHNACDKNRNRQQLPKLNDFVLKQSRRLLKKKPSANASQTRKRKLNAFASKKRQLKKLGSKPNNRQSASVRRQRQRLNDRGRRQRQRPRQSD